MKFRLLLADDNPSIHQDFHKVFDPLPDAKLREDLDRLEEVLFEQKRIQVPELQVRFHIDSAFQGKEALTMIRAAEKAGEPYFAVFIDGEMPPGWDGAETIQHIWQEFPLLDIVFLSAYFEDDVWERTQIKLGGAERLLFLRKPFDHVVLRRLTLYLAGRWAAGREQEKEQPFVDPNHVRNLQNEYTRLRMKLESLRAFCNGPDAEILAEAREIVERLLTEKPGS